MKEKVFVIVVNYNGGETIVDCLNSVKEWPVVVVDNNSSDGSLRKIKYQISKSKNKGKNTNQRSKIIENKENLGFGTAANIGIKYALKNGAEYVFLLNQDARVEEGTIEKLIEIMKKDKKIGICGPLIFANNKTIWSAGGVVDKKRYTGGHLYEPKGSRPALLTGRQTRTVKNVDFISGCAMMIKRQVFEKIGFFDERFFLYYEDVDFCVRARKAGFKVALSPQAVVYHQDQPTLAKEKIKQYYLAKNHFLFLEKHAPLRIKIREMFRLLKTIYEHLKRGEKQALLGIRDYFLGSFSANWRIRMTFC